MPSTIKGSIDRARVFDSEGAGGEPLGETPATPSGTRRRSQLSSAGVDDAVDRARLRELVKRPDGERIPDEVSDQLLALAKKIRTIELNASYPRRQPGGNHHTLNRERRRVIERGLAEHAQTAYEQTIAEWERHARTTAGPTPADLSSVPRYLFQRRDASDRPRSA